MRTLPTLSSTLILFFVSNSATADIIINDGGTTVIDSRVDDFFLIGGIDTRVIFRAGARVTGADGDDDSVTVGQQARVDIRRGIFAQDVLAVGRGRLNIGGGIIGDDVQAANRSRVRILGGTVRDDVEAFDQARILIAGGVIGEDVEAFGGIIRITGGTFTQTGIPDPGPETGFGSGGNGRIELIGRSFQLNGAPLDFGEITAVSGLLSGVLADGSSFSDIPFTRNLLGNGNLGSFAVTAIPEPSSFLLMGVCVLALLIRRHQIKAA